MPTQRPFLSNFLAAFRAHSALQSASQTTATTASKTNSTQTANLSTHSNPRSIASPTTKGATTSTLTTLHSPRTHSTGPLSTSPGAAHLQPNPNSQQQNPQQSLQGNGNGTGNSNSVGSIGSPGAGEQRGRYLTSSIGNRRGSDSSSEGFRDALGADKWYIGGRTAGGEERYFKLGVVRRRRSGGSLSLDRLSL
jgi:hypothetical protein